MTRLNTASSLRHSMPSVLIDPPLNLSPVISLAKPQRPKSKSLQPCRCPKEGCGKMFSKRSNLKAHMRVHSGVLPYPCTYPGCNKRFRWKSSLKPHVKVHLSSPTPPLFQSNIPSSTLTNPLDTTLTIPLPLSNTTDLLPCDQRPSIRGGLLNLPTFLECSRNGDKSPTVIMDSSLFTAPSPVHNNTELNTYHSSEVPAQAKNFARLSQQVEHENIENQYRNKLSVARVLFQDSHKHNDYMEQGELDLSCNSMLSGSQSSFDTDVVSFTLGSPEDSKVVSETDGSVELWKNEPNVMDPLLDLSDTFGTENKAIEILSACTSYVSNSNGENLSLSDSQWLIPATECSSSNADFPTNMYIA